MQLARDSLPDGDDEGRCDEDADLTEVDLFSVVVVAGCPEDDELDVVPVLLDLGTQVEALDVLDGQLVQAEAVADAFQLLGPGSKVPNQANPSLPSRWSVAAGRGGTASC